jgi:hypothetical protein
MDLDPVEVTARFDQVGKVTPLRFIWKGRNYPVEGSGSPLAGRGWPPFPCHGGRRASLRAAIRSRSGALVYQAFSLCRYLYGLTRQLNQVCCFRLFLFFSTNS